jgi:lysophospholipase L1-like esterase
MRRIASTVVLIILPITALASLQARRVTALQWDWERAFPVRPLKEVVDRHLLHRRQCTNSIKQLSLYVPLDSAEEREDAAARPAVERIVFVGDSITDGGTLPLLFRQALVDAKKPVPICINAGVASDTAALMRKRLERDVLPHKPTLVLFSAGINDIFRKVTPEEYEAEITAVAERLKAARIPLVLLTPSILGGKHAETEKKLADYIAAQRRIALKYDCRIADVQEVMKQYRTAGKDCLEADAVHLTFAGYQAMTRAVLNALGYKDVAVPEVLRPEVMPGILTEWTIRPIAEKEAPLDEKTVSAVKPGEGGKKYTLPEKEPVKQWWLEQERQRGFAVSLDKLIGPAKSYVGVTVLESPKARKVYFNTGSSLNAVWLNGKRLYKNEGWTGWHPGKERIPAELKEGKNVIVLESGSQFFLSVTETNDW